MSFLLPWRWGRRAVPSPAATAAVAVVTAQATEQPAAQPATQPAAQPATQPAAQPAAQSAAQSAELPTTQPAELPTTQPAELPATISPNGGEAGAVLMTAEPKPATEPKPTTAPKPDILLEFQADSSKVNDLVCANITQELLAKMNELRLPGKKARIAVAVVFE